MASLSSASAGAAQSGGWQRLLRLGLHTRAAAIPARSQPGLELLLLAGCWFASPELLYSSVLGMEPGEKIY